MTCSEAADTKVINVRDSCVFFTAAKPHYIKINARFSSLGMIRLSCAKPGCFRGHQAPIQVDDLRYEFNPETIIYQLPVVLKPRIINKDVLLVLILFLLGI